MQQQIFSAIHAIEDVRKNSSSGGAFTAITDAWMLKYKDKAVIYGCAFSEDLKAQHIRATKIYERDSMRGSKYISSDMSAIYRQVAQDISSGNYVVFSSTPCQIAGLIKYLKAVDLFVESQLLLIDFICHGVGSNRFFEEYISYLEKKYKSKAVSCSFRGKSSPDKISDMLVCFENGKRYISHATKYDWFYSVYYNNYILRPSCFNCKYARTDRVSDICLGDYWGELTADYSATSSLVIASTDKGAQWAKIAFKDMQYRQLHSDSLNQAHLQAPAQKPKDYDGFWRVFEDEGYLAVQKYIGNNCFSNKFMSKLAAVLDKTQLLRVAKRITQSRKK